MSRKTFIFAGGGTGGHLYPGLSVAQQIVKLDPDALCVFACSNREIDQKILTKYLFAIFPQVVKPITKSPTKIPAFLRAWFKSLSQAKQVLKDLKPNAVVGLGGFAAGPMVKIAAKQKIATALLNPDIVPGKANKYLASRVDKIFTQFQQTASFFNTQNSAKTQLVGCPVRPELLEGSRQQACLEFDLDPSRKTLLVFGGSMLASSLTDAVCELAPDFKALTENWQLLVIAGDKLADSTRQACQKHNLRATILNYCDKMQLAYACADFALCRGGAGTIAELSATATPAVILPYPHHADRQQYKNAQDGKSQGRFIVIDDHSDAKQNALSLRESLVPVMNSAEKLADMTKSAKQSKQDQAADIIARWLLEK